MGSTLISLLAGLGGMFGWGIYDFFAGVYSKKIGPFKTFFWSQFAGLIFALLLLLTFDSPLHLTLSTIALLLTASLLYSAGYLFFMRGFEIGNISIVAAIMNLWAVFTMLFAYLFMGQRLTFIQFVGVLMIISGATLASLNGGDLQGGKKFKLSLGVKEAAIGAFFFGLFWNISETVSEKIGWLPTTCFVKLLIIVLLLLFSLVVKRNISVKTATLNTRSMILIMGFIEAGAVALVNYGLTVGDAILITPIASALSIVTIGMAILFLKERVSKLQATGMVVAVAGIIVTSF